MKKLLLLAFLPLLFLACENKSHVTQVDRAFYYWKSTGGNNLAYTDSLSRYLKLKKLYVKFFEVEHDALMGNNPTVKTNLREYDSISASEIIPTVYIRNEVFLKTSQKGLDSLADNVHFLIDKFLTDRFPAFKAGVKEYQMDCDWTPKYKDNFFYFLKKLKQVSHKQLSCTLRLYPYKYPDKMGVPPVDKAMLMCYNLSHPLEHKDSNSILDTDELKSYLKGSEKYPLHLDVALPVYSWALLYQNETFKGIIYNTQFIDSTYAPVRPMWYRATQDKNVDEFFIRKGDLLKKETVDAAAINKAIAMVKEYVALKDTVTVSLFYLDNEQLKPYKYEEIAGFYSAFTQ